MKLFVLVLFFAAATCFGADRVWLTIYNQNYAVVRDVRSFALTEGVNEIRFDDISPMILDAPVRVSGEGIVAREQMFQFHRLNNDLLLNDNLEKRIELILDDSAKTVISGKLIGLPSANNYSENYFIQLADGSVRTVRSGDVKNYRYPVLPQDYSIRPALTLKVECATAGHYNVEAAYEAIGLDWGARYLLDLSSNDSAAVFSGWAIVFNAAGRAFDHARLTLVSGQPPRTHMGLRLSTDTRKASTQISGLLSRQPGFKVDPDGAMHIRSGRADEMTVRVDGVDFRDPLVQQREVGIQNSVHEQLFDLQTYTLPYETSLPDGAEKEMNLFAPAKIMTSTSYEYAWWQNSNKVGVYVQTVNTESAGLGVPLPAGPIAIYRMRGGNVPEYVGESMIPATAVHDTVRIRVGSAEGLVVQRNLINIKQHTSRKKDEIWEVRIKNERDTEVNVKIQDHFPTKWKILASSHPHNEITKNIIEFPVTISPDSEAVVTYEVRTWRSWEKNR